MEGGVKLHTRKRYCCGSNAFVEGDIFGYGSLGRSVGVVKITEPINQMLNYFEYVILNKGAKCAIGIGFGEHKYSLDRMPGWNSHGIGYHADDGRMFYQDGFGQPFGPTCTEGDRMGCGIDYDTDSGNEYCDVFFTKNGEQVGNIVKMKKPVHGLYPIVGFHSHGEKVRYLGHWKRQRQGLQEPMVLDHSPSNMWLRSNNVSFIGDGLTLEYNGVGGNKDKSVALGNLRLDEEHHYFEVTLIDSGRDGSFYIGLASHIFPLHELPGKTMGSVAYSASNGCLLNGSEGSPFGPKCTEGDVMGCGIKFTLDVAPTSAVGATFSEAVATIETDSEDEIYMDEATNKYFFRDMGLASSDTDDDDDIYEDLLLARREGWHQRLHQQHKVLSPNISERKNRVSENCVVYFTKNGEKVGDTTCRLPKGGFYPIVSMLSQGESLRVNFDPLTG